MESRNLPEHRIRIKIGLILLVIILYIAGVFIYSYNLKRNMDKQKKEITNSYKVLSYSDRLIVSVRKAQDMLNSYLLSPKKVFKQQYDSISLDISQRVTDIKKLSPEKNQNRLLEDIDSLLQEKNIIVNKLIAHFRLQNPLSELDKKIETYDELMRDTIVVTTHEDTITTVVKQKIGFWSRLKNLFSGEKPTDTTLNITRSEQKTQLISKVDTSVYAELRNITREASRTYSSNIVRIEKEVQGLILAEQNISHRISQLISEFYNEASETIRESIHNSEILSQRIFIFAILIGTLSLFLILVIIFFTIDDLNQGEKARLELAKEKQRTETLMESRHKLLLSVSHDIKTPLSSIMGYMEIWEQEETSEKKKRQLRSAQNSGEHILNMLSNLLEFSRLEQNLGKLHYSRFDLIELTEGIIAMFRPFIEEKKLNLEFENLAGSPFFIESDYTVLKQILVNLVSNAVKYTLRGSVCIRLQCNGELIFTITDTGIGMDEKDLEDVFKPFSRVKNPMKADGSGFGLYVTKGLVNSLKGNIAVKSEKGKGTSISVKIPVCQNNRSYPSGNRRHSLEGNKKIEKILIFEDDITLGKMIKEFLILKGYKVKLCNDPQDIKGFVRNISLFDIVFTDMQMINTSGTEILYEIRKKDSDIPVWLMTAYDDYTIERAESEGFAGFIKKPFQMGRLLTIVSGEKTGQWQALSLTERFPRLASLFENDTDAMKEILSGFVESSRKDMEMLTQSIEKRNFKEAQQVCHKIHPFFNQIDADYLCGVLYKMDRLRGQEENAYPDWQEELTETVRQIGLFTDDIDRSYLAD